MKIVAIFGPRLFSLVYQQGDSYGDNEYDRLMELWTDVEYLRNFALDNNVEDVDQFVRERLGDAENIEDMLAEIEETDKPLSHYFMPLHNNEYGAATLSKQKGKTSGRDKLRLYAIKIDEDCFLITGGAIKVSQAMQDHPGTLAELTKLEEAKAHLQRHGVFDEASFFEFKREQDDE